MSYVISSENCRGCQIKFIESDGELLYKPTSKEYFGTLALQTFDDTDYMRITFADTKNVFGGAIKKTFGIVSSLYKSKPLSAMMKGDADYLCHFDFTKEDLRLGKKKFKYNIQSFMYVLACYDMKSHNGCAYLFPEKAEAEKWIRKLGITEVEYLNESGKIIRVEPFR